MSAPDSRPANAWFPAALVSAIAPLLGLLWIRDGRDRRRLAWTVFGCIVVAHVALRLLHATLGVRGDGTESVFGTLLRAADYLALFASAGFGAIYTHDERVRATPALGAPVLFLRSVELPRRESQAP